MLSLEENIYHHKRKRQNQKSKVTLIYIGRKFHFWPNCWVIILKIVNLVISKLKFKKMKNLLTIFAFAFVLMFGIQNTYAQELSQSQDRPEVIAKAEVAKLTQELGLTGDQSRTIYRALVAKEVNYKKHINGKDLNDAKIIALKKEYDDNFNASMKKNLTPDQYNIWLKSKER